MSSAELTLAGLARKADIYVDRHLPWDIEVKDKRFYTQVLSKGTLGLGESYMDGYWECDRIDEMIFRALKTDIKKYIQITPSLLLHFLKGYFINQAQRKRAFQVGEQHYDIGNDLYEKMLDRRMTYSCGYWKDAQTLDEAQEAKLDLICKKIGIKKGDRVLDIGCGWGSFAGYAAERYGAHVVGITVSKEQQVYAEKRYAHLPVEFRLQDYRDLQEQFDHIISVGMFEHVGVKNYDTYMRVVNRCLKDDGLFLLHTIGGNRSVHATDPWIAKYIFPNSMLPSIRQIARASEKKFVLEDLHNFSAYYDRTLMNWYHNVEKAWGELGANYSERFYRMWRYYLLSCAGLFRARQGQLWQIVFSKRGVAGGYHSIR